jgi:hypothetical protein
MFSPTPDYVRHGVVWLVGVVAVVLWFAGAGTERRHEGQSK